MGDADITLRHVVRPHPEALVQALDVEGLVEIAGWLDTQVTALERRLDRVLGLRIDGAPRALHVEFEYALTRTLGRRVYEYQALFTLGRPEQEPHLPIESLVVVLTGRAKPWPAYGSHQTGWPEQGRQSNRLHYRIDAVYQRTVEELRARGSPLWLVFTPLARDATPAAMRRVVEELEVHVSDPVERADLYTALLTMADVGPWGYTLRREIEMLLMDIHDKDKLLEVSQTLQDAFKKGERKGIAQGVEKGIAQGVEKGRREAVEEMLRRLFFKRVGRAPSEEEQAALSARSQRDPAEVQDRALSLEGDALVAWLLDRDAK